MWTAFDDLRHSSEWHHFEPLLCIAMALCTIPPKIGFDICPCYGRLVYDDLLRFSGNCGTIYSVLFVILTERCQSHTFFLEIGE